MLKVPRMLDEIDPLPQLRSADGWVFSGGRKIAASKRHVAKHDPPEPQWLLLPGRPHFYTRNGKLKYEPPLPESAAPKSAASYCDLSPCSANPNPIAGSLTADEYVTFQGIDSPGPLALGYDLLAALRAKDVVLCDSTAAPDSPDQIPWPQSPKAMFAFSTSQRFEYEALYRHDLDMDKPIVIRLVSYA